MLVCVCASVCVTVFVAVFVAVCVCWGGGGGGVLKGGRGSRPCAGAPRAADALCLLPARLKRAPGSSTEGVLQHRGHELDSEGASSRGEPGARDRALLVHRAVLGRVQWRHDVVAEVAAEALAAARGLRLRRGAQRGVR